MKKLMSLTAIVIALLSAQVFAPEFGAEARASEAVRMLQDVPNEKKNPYGGYNPETEMKELAPIRSQIPQIWQTKAQKEIEDIKNYEARFNYGAPQGTEHYITSSQRFIENLVDPNLIKNLQNALAELQDAAQQRTLTRSLGKSILAHEDHGEYEEAEYLKNYFKTNIGKGHPIDDPETLQAIQGRYNAANINFNNAHDAFETAIQSLRPIQAQRAEEYYYQLALQQKLHETNK